MENKFIEYEKLSKKEKRKRDRKKRTVVNFNTGTRVHKNSLHPSRMESKRKLRKMIEENKDIE